MPLDKSIPNWPQEAIDALAAVQKETPKGCGGCVHAEWVAARDAATSPGNVQHSITFGLGACRADVRLGVASNGLRAVLYCTAWNLPTANGNECSVDQSDSASVGSVACRVEPPMVGSPRRQVTGSPSIVSPPGSKLFSTI